MDIEEWNRIKNISKLNGSLNPADFTQSLENIKQYHLIGSNDKIIPKEIFFSYKNRFKNKKNIEYFIYMNLIIVVVGKRFIKGIKYFFNIF